MDAKESANGCRANRSMVGKRCELEKGGEGRESVAGVGVENATALAVSPLELLAERPVKVGKKAPPMVQCTEADEPSTRGSEAAAWQGSVTFSKSAASRRAAQASASATPTQGHESDPDGIDSHAGNAWIENASVCICV